MESKFIIIHDQVCDGVSSKTKFECITAEEAYGLIKTLEKFASKDCKNIFDCREYKGDKFEFRDIVDLECKIKTGSRTYR